MRTAKLRKLTVLLESCLALALSFPVFGLEIVKDGKSRALIIVADDAGIYPKRAAVELQKHIKLVSGAYVRIVPESKLKKVQPGFAVISIGHTRRSTQAGINAPVPAPKGDWRRLMVKGNTLYLLGKDQRPLQSKPALSPLAGSQGTFAAVAEFIRDYLKCRWFVPCPMGKSIPKNKNIIVSDKLDRVSCPKFAIYHIYGHELVGSYANNSRMLQRVKLYGYHTWDVMFNYRKYFKTNPGYFALAPDGKRVRNRNYLCTSNPELEQAFVKNIRKLFDQGYDVVQLGQADGWHGCCCDKCMKLDKHHDYRTVTRDNPCEKIFYLHNKIIRECAKSHPDKKIQLVIYSPSFWPSKADNKAYSNVCGIFCPIPERRMALTGLDPISQQSISDWRKKNVKEFAEYQYFFDGLINPLAFLPQVSPEWLRAKMKWNIKNGINNGGGRFPALSWPLVYANARFAENPEIPAYEPIKEYCNFIYGKAAEPMFEFYKKLYSKAEKVWLNRKKIFADTYPAQMAFTSAWSVADIAELDKLISQAEKLANSERSRNFLRKTRLEFNGLKYLLLAFTAKKQFEAAKNIKNLLKVKKYVDDFENWRDGILKLYATDKSFLKNYWPNYELLCITLMSKGRSWGPLYAKLRKQLPAAAKGTISFRGCAVGSHLAHAEINEPLTWNFDEMLKRLAATGDTRDVFRVSRIPSPPVKQGKINLAAWSKTPAIDLAPFKRKKSASNGPGTKVKLACDQNALYVLFECVEPRINLLKLYSGARDGSVYAYDSVELFLNPECAPKKTFQFIVSPAEGAFFDAKRDYEVSAANPNKLPIDSSWNPDFSYLYTIDKASGRYYVQFAIPFSSLGGNAPQAGKVWWANFCRNRIVNLPKPELFSWSTETFGHNPASFNKLIFERKEK